ncbi:ribonuclease H-like domain-containing protein [Dichomitus squalens]|uniref:Ribonuclease H-like domain-containing protein n=1 Tax=Dichomitus squalens TaxID=114155 RepID=A0A4Q9PH33_9APHY|nr:ribonuclease H-like domain-containing protein [Dichomitus squalens]TBU52661.1 ribonuclease H-like domain-containing protein [Dichomitus squalens]
MQPGTSPQDRFTLVSTYLEAAQAATVLASFPVLIVGCEGESLGHPHGSLTLLSISTPDGSRILLIDVLALRDPNNPSLKPLLALLSSNKVLKVFWDGRTDVLELSLTYGVCVAPVLDLQVAEVVHRSKWQSKDRHLRALAEKTFKSIRNEVLANPAVFDGIYPLIGLDGCLRY